MNEHLNKEEYLSLRDEIFKYNDKRIAFSQIAVSLVTAYTGFMIGKDQYDNISWQFISIFPLLVLSITVHISRLYELYQIRAGAYLAIFHNSTWENNVENIKLFKRYKIGYNKSWSIIYLLISACSTTMFVTKFKSPFYCWQTAVFAFFLILFLILCISLFRFDTSEKKRDLKEQWESKKK